MSSPSYDIVTVGDFRFPGGTSTAIAEELRAQAGAGYRTGLIQLKGPVLGYPHPIHPKIRACLDEGLADLLDPDLPVSAGLVLAHHPSLFTHPPRRALAVDAPTRLLIVHHPPLDGAGEPAYDPDAIRAHAEATLGGPVLWAPIGPAVRTQLDGLDAPPPGLDFDWHNVLDPGPWRVERAQRLGPRPVIGRHSRPDPLKWPADRETVLAAYPDDPDVVVRILGGGPYLRELVGAYPRNWRVWPFNAMPAEHFLGMLDFFVYFHHPRWVEAFGRTILEALASGAVCVLPEHFRELFADAAVYARPDEVRAVVRALHVDRRAFGRQSELGAALVRERFGPATHVARVRELIGPPRRSIPAPSPPRRRRRVLFTTSNGVGIGHLTRMLAVARRCPEPLEPVFLTMSQATRVVREQGFLVEHLPFHRRLGCDIQRWNAYLREEIDELIAFYDPAALVFDGNVPYQGMIDALGDNPEIWSVWCRRGMWQPERGRDALAREGRFDAVVEPRDLAERHDRGLTIQHRARTRIVEPVRLLDDDEVAPREAARAALGLDGDRPAVLVQLGAENNYDYAAIRRAAFDLLRRRHDADVLAARWPIAEAPLELPDDVRAISAYPLGRHLRAFDLVVSAVGYNSFHEILLAGVPAIFVPNENPQQDDQLGRARFAEREGLGVAVRTREVYRLAAAIERLLDPAERLRIATRAAELPRANGAPEIVRMLEEMVHTRKADRP